MRFLFFFLLLFLPFSSIFAQNENNVWIFGDHTGVSFNSGTPVAVNGSMMNAFEGCASVCDSLGSLLFYTDGSTVWNRINQQMPNGTGLYGDYTSTQSATIVRQPGSLTTYYIFTTDSWFGPNGLQYSQVDMSLAGGYGQVTVKNIYLNGPVAEKATAIKNGNGTDIWLLSHLHGSDAFIAYNITVSGISPTPVVSHAGTVMGGPTGPGSGLNSLGYLRASRQGNRLACAIFGLNMFEIYDFNNITGVVSNAIPVTGPFPYIYTYGVEFSPDGSKLYTKMLYSGDIYQYDLLAGSPSAIVASGTLVGTATAPFQPVNYISGALRLGPDNKIYISKYTSNYLAVLNYPNNPAASCGFVDNAVSLGSGLGNLGLPNESIVTFAAPQFTWDSLCFGDLTHFSMTDSTLVDSVTWNFDDPASGPANISHLLNPAHQFTAPGDFHVTLYSYIGTIIDTVVNTVTIKLRPVVELGSDTLVCDGGTLYLTSPSAGATYLWQNGSTVAGFTATSSGQYWLQVDLNGCIASDTINVEIHPPIPLELGSDTTLCHGDSLLIGDTTAGAAYLWQNGSTLTEYTVTASGKYWLRITLDGCSTSDTILVSFLDASSVNLGHDTMLCNGSPIVLDAGNPGAAYLWQDGSTDMQYTVLQPGEYWVVVSLSGCSASDTIYIDYGTPPELDLGPDTVVCPDNPITLVAQGNGETFLWKDGSTQPSLLVTKPGIYWVTAFKSTCFSTDSVKVEECPPSIWFPNTFTPNADGINETFGPKGENIYDFKMYVFNRWGQMLFETSDMHVGWDGTYMGSDCPVGVYFFVATWQEPFSLRVKRAQGSITLLK